MNWLERLLQNGPVHCDGAMGTTLMKAGLRLGESAERWNVDAPDKVGAVHRGYADAGSGIVCTNTFCGSPLALVRHGLADRAAELNSAGVRLAKDAVGGRARILGDLGPFGGFVEPYGDTTQEELEAALRVQLEAFWGAGADGVMVETMGDPTELETAVRTARAMGDWPVIATYAFQRQGGTFRTLMGTTVVAAMKGAVAAGADAVGANCGVGLSLSDYLDLAKEAVAHSQGKPIVVQPNAGAPHTVDGAVQYVAAPEDFAAWALEAKKAGVGVFGGCCGTGPAHIQAMAEALRDAP